MNTQPKRKLEKDAVPTKFSSKKTLSKRVSPKKRIETQVKRQVWLNFVFFIPGIKERCFL